MPLPHPAFGGSVSALVHNQLEMPNKEAVRAKFMIATGQTLKKGSILGAMDGTAGTATAAADGGNTGDGAISAVTLSGKAKVGIYVATCIVHAGNGGTFRVEDPDGYVLGDVAVGTEFSDDIVFTISDGAVDFIVGDKFNITVTAAATKGHLKLSEAAAVDGSEIPMAILGEDLDTTAGARLYQVYVEGAFNEGALVYGTGHSADTVRIPLRDRGIYLDVPRHSYFS